MKKLLLLLMCPIIANAHQITQAVWFKNFPPDAVYNNEKIQSMPRCDVCSAFNNVYARYPANTPARDPLGTKPDRYDLECSGGEIFGKDSECVKKFTTEIDWYAENIKHSCTLTVTLKIDSSTTDSDHTADYSAIGSCKLSTEDGYWVISPQ